MTPAPLRLPSRQLDAGLLATLNGLAVGDRITITHTVRVGAKAWPATASGVYRGVSYLSTGVTTDRVAADDIVMPTVHFTKDNGELTSVALDENTRIAKG